MTELDKIKIAVRQQIENEDFISSEEAKEMLFEIMVERAIKKLAK